MAAKRHDRRPCSVRFVLSVAAVLLARQGAWLFDRLTQHSVRELDHMHWGVEMARKGGVPANRVLDAMPLAEIMRFLAKDRPLSRVA